MGLILRVVFYFLFFSFFEIICVSGTEISEKPDLFFPEDTLKPAAKINLKDSLLSELTEDSLKLDALISPILMDSGIVVRDGFQTSSRPQLNSFYSKSPDTVKYWKTGGCFTLNVSQVSLMNWSAGGQNSVAANGLFNFTANYSKGNIAWDNTVDFGFGRLKRENAPAIKTDDKLEISTKYGRRISRKLYYSALVNFKTQTFPGYDYPEKDSIKISDFLSPATVFLSVGVDFRPDDKLSFLLSAVTGKTTIVKSGKLSGRGYFGVKSGEHFRHEFGGYFKLVKKGSLLKLVNYQLKLDAFSNYMKSPGNIDWDCELMVWARLNRFVTANFKANLLYDDDIVTPPNLGARLQLKQYLGLGFTYRF